MGCRYLFRHHDRPRSHCDRAAEDGVCVWHDHVRTPARDVRARLTADVARGEWLEGIVLADQDLSGLHLASAKMPMADLESADLSGSILPLACLDGANLRSADLSGAHLDGASLTNVRGHGLTCRKGSLCGASLSGAQLDGADLRGSGLKGIILDVRTSIDGVHWEYPKEFHEARFGDAAAIFRVLGRHARDVSDYGASEYFYRLEMTALHLLAIGATEAPVDGPSRRRVWRPKLANLWSWAGWGTHRVVWGYGASPWRTLAWMMGVILAFSCVYPILGISNVPPTATLTTKIVAGLAVSLVTFPTLGYGTRTAEGLAGEIVGGFEALLGSILMSMFLVSLATRYVHRG
jgi:pentapeptide repeat protein